MSLRTLIDLPELTVHAAPNIFPLQTVLTVVDVGAGVIGSDV
jgi:hypothetical protein